MYAVYYVINKSVGGFCNIPFFRSISNEQGSTKLVSVVSWITDNPYMDKTMKI